MPPDQLALIVPTCMPRQAPHALDDRRRLSWRLASGAVAPQGHCQSALLWQAKELRRLLRCSIYSGGGSHSDDAATMRAHHVPPVIVATRAG